MNWDFAGIEKTRWYDFAMALPLMLWFGYSAWRIRPYLIWDAGLILAGRSDLQIVLQFFGLFAAAAFNLLVAWMLVARTMPVKKSRGLVPRLVGFAGTFASVGILQLKVASLPLSWQIASDILVMGGNLAAALILSRLGRAFSIMPEARLLVTRGPYAWARHPLYTAEAVIVTGIAIQFQQPWAGLLAAVVVALQITRSVFEEQVLAEAYPEYEAYRACTKRFIPGVI
jgi:protein-S-isoprenylcysteine O-methyltransferase Ste14